MTQITATRRCSTCGEERESSLFPHFKGRPSGQCRMCKTASERARRERLGVPVKKLSVVGDGKKLCMHCGVMKALGDFSPSSRGRGGVSAYCKSCFAGVYRQSRGAARAATAAYRERHKERSRAQHRVRMFEYRTKKKVTSDGSVTDKLLKDLYSTEECYYCAETTPRGLRTLDHRVPLAKGGGHTKGNLVMACWTCNCSKRDMSESEFIERIKRGTN